MGRRSLVLAAIVLVALGCELLPSGGAAVPEERMPGPAWYLVTVEPEEAIDTRDIVLTSNGDHHVRVEDVLAGEAPSGTLLVSDGHRLLSVITVPWPPSFLHAAVDGTRCDGQVELTEDHEVDVTLVVAQERCALVLDRRHRKEDGVHRVVETEPGPSAVSP
jgi:hypothetical protein